MMRAVVLEGGRRSEPGALVTWTFRPWASVLPSGHPARGLYLRLGAGKGATILVTVGTAPGGQAQRRFSLTPAGAWLSVAAWELVTIRVEAVSGTDTVVEYAWTTEQPAQATNLLLVQALDATGAETAVPEGARKLAVSAALAGFAWQCHPSGTTFTIAQALAAATPVDVLGDTYTNAVANVTAAWILDPL